MCNIVQKMFKNNSRFWEKKKFMIQKFYYKLNFYLLLRGKTFKACQTIFTNISEDSYVILWMEKSIIYTD